MPFAAKNAGKKRSGFATDASAAPSGSNRRNQDAVYRTLTAHLMDELAFIHHAIKAMKLIAPAVTLNGPPTEGFVPPQ